jgi:hypothetical protein
MSEPGVVRLPLNLNSAVISSMDCMHSGDFNKSQYGQLLQTLGMHVRFAVSGTKSAIDQKCYCLLSRVTSRTHQQRSQSPPIQPVQ